MARERATAPLHLPLDHLEAHLISAYLAGGGADYHELLLRSESDDNARRLIAKASQYASAQLSEIEARSLYLHDLHGV